MTTKTTTKHLMQEKKHDIRKHSIVQDVSSIRHILFANNKFYALLHSLITVTVQSVPAA